MFTLSEDDEEKLLKDSEFRQSIIATIGKKSDTSFRVKSNPKPDIMEIFVKPLAAWSAFLGKLQT